MKIIVCMKLVIDPEAPVSAFKVDTEAKRVIPPKGTPPVLNPFDENALEAALKIKDAGNTEITVISLGQNLARPIVRKALAVGADKLVLLEDKVFEDLDSFTTAHILVAAIKKVGDFDLILCGRESADTDAGQVGLGIAEMLGIPSVSMAGKIETVNGIIRVKQVLSDGYETIEAPLPALVTASNEIGELRYASITAIMAAQKKPIIAWSALDLGIDPGSLKRVKLHSLSLPPRREGNCEIVAGESPEAAASNLALKLRENKIF